MTNPPSSFQSLSREALEALVDDPAHITMPHPCDVGLLSDAAYAARTALTLMDQIERLKEIVGLAEDSIDECGMKPGGKPIHKLWYLNQDKFRLYRKAIDEAKKDGLL